MRKLTVLAMLAAVLMAGSAFAVERHLTPSTPGHNRLTPAPNATFAFGVGGAAFGPSTTNNNDSCDITLTPAATLLLPYFEVDFNSPQTTARTTLFTVVNTSLFPQIAHVTLWTDWSFAVLDFNIFLTGYDVQPINMYDIFARGIIAPPSGTSITGSANGPPQPALSSGSTSATRAANAANGAPGALPSNNLPAPGTGTLTGGNPNFLASATTDCVGLPGAIPAVLLADIRTIFTTGAAGTVIGAGCATRLGGTHANAIGYATIDVAAHCSTSFPGPAYFSTEVLFDNTLTGDYEDVFPNPAGAIGTAAGGAPLVHIQAIPEGGLVGSIPAPIGSPAGTPGTNLPFTFYDRYTGTSAVSVAGRTIDRRQPLPSMFAARWIQGGTGSFNTNFRIWREGYTGGPLGAALGSACTSAAVGVPINNSALAITDEVRFDEHENAVGVTIPGQISPPITGAPVLPETSNTPTSTSLPFPGAVPGSADVGGWMYLNLANGGVPGTAGVLTAQRAGFGVDTLHRSTTQNWVVVNMQASPSLSATFDATHLANGCTPATANGAVITTGAQRGGPLVCPPPLVVGVTCGAGTLPPFVTP